MTTPAQSLAAEVLSAMEQDCGPIPAEPYSSAGRGDGCALCWKTPGNPIHTDTGKAERKRLGLPEGWPTNA